MHYFLSSAQGLPPSSAIAGPPQNPALQLHSPGLLIWLAWPKSAFPISHGTPPLPLIMYSVQAWTCLTGPMSWAVQLMRKQSTMPWWTSVPMEGSHPVGWIQRNSSTYPLPARFLKHCLNPRLAETETPIGSIALCSVYKICIHLSVCVSILQWYR